MEKIVEKDPYYKARVSDLQEVKPIQKDKEFNALVSSIKDLALRIIEKKVSSNKPDIALVLAWNFFDDIKTNNKDIAKKLISIKDLEKQ